ncbi:unnamed protein product [Urochloa humidicola]
MPLRPPPPESGDSHGDAPTEHQSSPRSPTSIAITNQSTSDRKAQGEDLQTRPNLAVNESETEEIEPHQAQFQAQDSDHSSKEAVQEQLSPVEPHHINAAQPQQQDDAELEAIILPDLAQDLRLQASFKSTWLDAGTEDDTTNHHVEHSLTSVVLREGAGHEGDDADPLVFDLLQRHSNHGIFQDPLAAQVMELEKRKFTRAEKVKGIGAAMQPRQQSNQLQRSERSNVARSKQLQQGECSRTMESGGHKSHISQAWFSSGSRHQRHQQQESSIGKSTRTHRGDSTQPQTTVDEQGFQVVKPAYWWRKNGDHSMEELQIHQLDMEAQRRKRYLGYVRGKCLNCFSTEHRVASCRYTTRCWRCLQIGHKAVACPSRGVRAQPHHTSAASPCTAPPYTAADRAVYTASRSYLQVVKGEPTPLATYPGDPRGRPDYAACTISATGPIKRKRDALIGKTMVCWLTGNRHDTGTHHVIDALDEQLHISRHDVRVVKHFPEQYLVFFSDSRAYYRVLHYRRVRNRGRMFNFEPWTERRNSVESKLEFRVRLRIEGMPVHAWSEEVVAQIIGQHCAIHYVEEHTRRQERTRTYDLWAWSSNPSKIPKNVLLSITDPDREQPAIDIPEFHHDQPKDFKRAFDYKLHIHLEVVEDLSFLRGRGVGDGPHNRKPRREFLWNYGASDSMGERWSGQNHDNFINRDYRPCLDSDNHDDYHRSTKHQCSVSSRGRAMHGRGAVEDCYSSTRHPGGDQGHSDHRNRALNPGWSTGEHPCMAWRKKGKGVKRVSFANPLVQILGESEVGFDSSCCPKAMPQLSEEREWFDPMREETLIPHRLVGHPSKESRILNMLSAAAGWTPVASPGGASCAREEEDELLETGEAAVHVTTNTSEHSQVCQESDHQPSLIANNSGGITSVEELDSSVRHTHSVDDTQRKELQCGNTEFIQANTFSASLPALRINTIVPVDAISYDIANVNNTVLPQDTNADIIAEHLADANADIIAEHHVELELPNSTLFPVDANTSDIALVNTSAMPQDANATASASAVSNEGNTFNDFSAFIDFISCKPPTPLLNTPPRLNPIQPDQLQPESTTAQRKSTRLADKAKLNPGKDSIQLAQKVLSDKLGELSPKAKQNTNADFNRLAKHLPQPLTSMNMEAIRTLVEKGNQPKNRKKSKITPAQIGQMDAQMA